MNKGDWIERTGRPDDYFLPPLAIVRKVRKNFVLVRQFNHKNINGELRMFIADHMVLNADLRKYYRPIEIPREAEEKSEAQWRAEALDVLNRQSARLIYKNNFLECKRPNKTLFVNPGGVQQRIF